MSGTSDKVAVLAQFSILMDELLRTGLRRAKFQQWEIDILLDIESCPLGDIAKRTALHEYENAVQSEMESGAPLPMRFSEFLQRRGSPRKPEGRELPATLKAKTGSS
jgi:hypothetical protein